MSELPYSIYLCQNKINNKKYVGLTNKTLKRRFQEHKGSVLRGSRLMFHSALRKYSIENFQILSIKHLKNTFIWFNALMEKK